ncbi:NUDIX domain-containing protein [Nocardioides zeae]|uniref:NUDIX domain-containing protein n=1 Tax=Nocardioides imazamoxiresistens TaxID=3231893 RepID=A0ABU3PYE6_9ACTN|nr:NUDIX domain-containing protein [Nocardioides zeae]MDT9594263.1 NUDIX domain-containing protein [Nocardioides zeae]
MPLHFVVAAVCLQDADGRVLTVRKRGTERFMLPGGKIEAGETPEQTAVREIAEEIGVELRDLALLGVFEGAAANEPGASLHSTVFTATTDGEPAAAAEIAEVRWVDPAAPPAGLPLAPMLEENVLPLLVRP